MDLNLVVDNIENTIIKKSKIHGMGLFATSVIKKDTLLCVLQGQVIPRSQYKELLENKAYTYLSFIEKYNIDENNVAAMPFRTKYSYINHASEPNIYSYVENNLLFVFSSRDIQVNEEIVDTYNLKKHVDVIGGFS